MILLRLLVNTLVLALTLIASRARAAPMEPQQISLKVNFGGDSTGDFLGDQQVLDMQDFSKNYARVPIQNTDQPEIFQTQLFSRGDFLFRVPVPDGIYSLTLLFAETFEKACVPGARVFDISLGTPVSGIRNIIDEFDVFAASGCASAHGQRFDNVPSKDGIIVHLRKRAQNPSIAGFIVEGLPTPRRDGLEFKTVGRTTEAGDDSTAWEEQDTGMETGALLD